MKLSFKIFVLPLLLGLFSLVPPTNTSAQTPPACSGVIYERFAIDQQVPELTTTRLLAGATIQIGTTEETLNLTSQQNGYWETGSPTLNGSIVYIDILKDGYNTAPRIFPISFSSNTCLDALDSSPFSTTLDRNSTFNPCDELNEKCCYTENTDLGTASYYCDSNSGLVCNETSRNGVCIDPSDLATPEPSCKWTREGCAPAKTFACPEEAESYCNRLSNNQNSCESAHFACPTINVGKISGPYVCDDGKSIDTAIGCIPVNDMNALVGFFLRWALGIGGGVAFFLIVFAAFQIITSAGDPDKLNAGKQLITAALSGLILLIFSVFLLQFLGVEIFHLPGLGE